ncbi:MAG: 1-aminocyclopropane-1-carboxylate deaminase/D-cysteine desulfhydrase [Sinomicrobium sp.]|nr:1-aminocyclopropane-1-carboxylate deaminase/D-cysteine desulfhydrase [Sinomicrobium sp.]
MEFPNGIRLFMKREDRIHPLISGNKYRKLKYIVTEAQRNNYRRLLSFGGAFSNHIAAVAATGAALGFETVGIIRGEELQTGIGENPTLRHARKCGMTLKFVSRDAYRRKHTASFLQSLKTEFGACYIIPEGGTNALAVKGCEEILTDEDRYFDVICCPVGTGGTLSGLINRSHDCQYVLGFSALKGDFLKNDIRKFVRKTNWEIVSRYHFGGYGMVNAELIGFINDFKATTGIPLDPVYTGKMMYGIVRLITEGYFKADSQLLAIHTGGLQGIAGMNIKLEQKQLPKIR